MLAIRAEIAAVEAGKIDGGREPPAPCAAYDGGPRARLGPAYSREEGCFPPGAFRVDKYWPPVNRVDNAYGDRHLVCTCPPLEEYLDAAE
jgi:glycine dehydrogenase